MRYLAYFKNREGLEGAYKGLRKIISSQTRNPQDVKMDGRLGLVLKWPGDVEHLNKWRSRQGIRYRIKSVAS